jgi:hypothetical protein
MPSPNRKQHPADLPGAIRATLASTGETLPQWAQREDVPLRTAETWVDPARAPNGAMARLTARLLAERL